MRNNIESNFIKNVIAGIKSKIKGNLLIRVASFNSLSVFVRLLSGFIISKAFAYFLLPSGMAITGNLRSFLSSCQGISTGVTQNGVIKFVSEHKRNQDNLKQIISTSFFTVIFFTALVSTVLFFLSDFFSDLIFNTAQYVYAIKILAFVLPIYTINIFLLSVINGLEKYKIVIVINTLGYVANVIFLLIALYYYGLTGAIIAMVMVPSVMLLITLYWVKEVKIIVRNISFNSFSNTYLKGLSSFFVMAIFSALTIPIVHVILKNHIISNIGVDEAGYWEAMIKISQYYLIFATSLFGLYLLPRLSDNKTDAGFRAIVLEYYKSIVPFVIVGFFFIYIFRYWIVRITLTAEFIPTKDLFFWQLVGDFFKIISFAIAYQLQAKKMLGYYLLGESLFVIVVYFASIYFINIFNVKGAVIGHAVSYIFYFVLMLVMFRKQLFSKPIHNN